MANWCACQEQLWWSVRGWNPVRVQWKENEKREIKDSKNSDSFVFTVKGCKGSIRELILILFGGIRDWCVCKQVALVVKIPPGNARDVRDSGSLPGSRRPPGGGHGNSLQYSCLEKPHGQRSLAGYSPWGWKELDTTEANEHARVCTLVGMIQERWELWWCRQNGKGSQAQIALNKGHRVHATHRPQCMRNLSESLPQIHTQPDTYLCTNQDY